MIRLGAIAVLSLVVGAIGVAVWLWKRRSAPDLSGRHVLVVGGSSGIGRAAAECAVRLGADVVIAARDPVRLEAAAADLRAARRDPDQRVHAVAMDIAAGAEAVQEGFDEAVRLAGPVHMLISCAGTAICGRLEDTPVKDVQFLTNLNFLGSLWLARAALPSMKARGEGHIVFVSSLAAMLGIYGYSAYGATKWAIRGLGEALMMETVGTGVKITVSFPPDTDTPGFELEEASKPTETKIISGGGGLYSPHVVAEKLIYDALRGAPYSTIGLDGWMLNTICGVTSEGFFSTLFNATLMAPLRIVLMGYEYYFHYVIKKCRTDKNINKKAN